MNKLVIAGAMVAVMAAPLMLILGFGGTDQEAAAVTGTLNVNAVPQQYQAVVIKAAATCPTFTGPVLAAQIEQESGWNPAAKSPAGAEGISQFLPSTWATWKVHADPNTVAADIWDPIDAIMTQARYDCALATQVQHLITAHQATGDVLALALAAYNAGVGAVEQYHGIPPYPQTVAYVKDILAGMAVYTASGTVGGTTVFGSKVIAAARKYLGTPYSWGGGSITGPTLGIGEGSTTDGFDCSGLTMYAVYQASGGTIVLPHSSEQQATMGTPETMATIQPGDLIAIQTEPGDFSHVVIYLGAGQILEAPKTGETVRIASLSEYSGMVQSIRRFT